MNWRNGYQVVYHDSALTHTAHMSYSSWPRTVAIVLHFPYSPDFATLDFLLISKDEIEAQRIEF